MLIRVLTLTWNRAIELFPFVKKAEKYRYVYHYTLVQLPYHKEIADSHYLKYRYLQESSYIKETEYSWTHGHFSSRFNSWYPKLLMSQSKFSGPRKFSLRYQ